MNLREFGALKPGDKIEVPMMPGSTGLISAVTDSGVKVRWGATTVDWVYTVNSTAWMHWSKLEPEDNGEG